MQPIWRCQHYWCSILSAIWLSFPFSKAMGDNWWWYYQQWKYTIWNYSVWLGMVEADHIWSAMLITWWKFAHSSPLSCGIWLSTTTAFKNWFFLVCFKTIVLHTSGWVGHFTENDLCTHCDFVHKTEIILYSTSWKKWRKLQENQYNIFYNKIIF